MSNEVIVLAGDDDVRFVDTGGRGVTPQSVGEERAHHWFRVTEHL